MITDLFIGAITMTDISRSFTYKMAAKIDWHRYGTKLRRNDHIGRYSKHANVPLLCIFANLEVLDRCLAIIRCAGTPFPCITMHFNQ